MFDTINENLDDYKYQKEIVEVLENLDVKTVIIDHMNKHLGIMNNSMKLKKYLVKRDLINFNAEEWGTEFDKVSSDSSCSS